MNDLNDDPVFNVIQNQIKRSIRVLIENQCYGAAAILIYSGIDTMAYLRLPINEHEVKRRHFIAWAEQYIKFPGRQQITGLELYGARCGMLHTYSPYSNVTRNSQGRAIGYLDQFKLPVAYNPNVDPDLVLVTIEDLAEQFFNGVDKYLVETFSDSKKAKLAEARLQDLTHTYPYRPS
jgi:hypothetical protein